MELVVGWLLYGLPVLVRPNKLEYNYWWIARGLSFMHYALLLKGKLMG